MPTEIPYGQGYLTAELPRGTEVIRPGGSGHFAPTADLAAEVRRALDAPVGSLPVEALVRRGARVTIAFDDPTVMSFGPIRQVAIEALLERLESVGVRREDVTLICANSLHRKFRSEELAPFIGQALVDEFGERLICHDAEDRAALVDLGRTPGGYDVELSRHVVEADLTVYVNAAHNRGFSGGWKSVAVGLSTYRSIRHHHTPDGMSMSLHNNRMHRVLDEMGTRIEAGVRGPIFKIDTILASPFEAAEVLAGSVSATRRAAVERLAGALPDRRQLVDEPFDVVLYGVPSWSPYAVFASMNPLLTLVSSGLGYLGGTAQAISAPGATVIMVTPCPDEWDTVHHASYPRVWQQVLPRTRDPYEIQSQYAERYAQDADLIAKYRHEYAFHPVHAILACYPLSRLKHFGQVLVVGPQKPAVVRHLGFEAASTIDEALRLAARRHGQDFRLAYIEQPATSAK